MTEGRQERGRRWPYLLPLALVLAAGAVYAATQLGTSDLSLGEARAAIEGLPYETSMHEENGVLLGRARGGHGATLWFAVTPDLHSAGVPAALRRADWNVTGGGGLWVYENGEFPRRGEPGSRWRERGSMAVEIEEALCRKSTGKACPV